MNSGKSNPVSSAISQQTFVLAVEYNQQLHFINEALTTSVYITEIE